jgi:hypothetical protein
MNIVGLGGAGCNIADAFSQYPQYNIFKIDVDISGDRCYSVPKLSGAEEYEKHSFPKLDSFFGDIRKNKEEQKNTRSTRFQNWTASSEK